MSLRDPDSCNQKVSTKKCSFPLFFRSFQKVKLSSNSLGKCQRLEENQQNNKNIILCRRMFLYV